MKISADISKKSKQASKQKNTWKDNVANDDDDDNDDDYKTSK